MIVSGLNKTETIFPDRNFQFTRGPGRFAINMQWCQGVVNDVQFFCLKINDSFFLLNKRRSLEFIPTCELF